MHPIRIFTVTLLILFLGSCHPNKIPDKLESAEVDSIRVHFKLEAPGVAQSFLLSKQQTEEFCTTLNEAKEMGLYEYCPMTTFSVFQKNNKGRFFRSTHNLIKEKSEITYKFADTLVIQKLFKQYFKSDTLP